ncbi:S9 family peptidase [Flavobacteriaceae bacterium AH-315-B10]|nr:S9 family peptidase [Flavobacteriaceae bacterium AH-315-B10]
MYKYLLTLFLTFNLFNSYAQKAYSYPDTPRDSVTDVYFGTLINDPYQWMENPEDTRLVEWKESQEKIKKKHANRHLKMFNLRAQLSSMYYGVRAEEIEGYVENKKGKSKYQFAYKYQSYGRTPNLLYRLRGKSNYIRLVDIKDFRYDKNDNVVITKRYVNEEYDLVAIEISHNGSDWREIFFFNLKNGQQLHNSLKNVRISSKLIWHGRNVYYDRYDEPIMGRELLDKATGQKLYYHKVGTPQSEDKLLYQNPDSTITNSFRYFKLKDKLFFYNTYRYRGKIYKALSASTNNPDSLFLKKFLIYPNDDAINVKIDEVFGDSVVLKTNWNAPNGRVLLSNINELNKPVEIIPEYDVVLRSVNRLGKDKIACTYRNENKYLALIFDLEGNLLKRIDFPEGKKVNYLYENDEKVEYTEFSVSSFYHPDLWYQLSLKDLTFKPSLSISVPYDHESLETRYVKYTSKDGTQIPMYITCLKDTKLDGKNPTLLYGYGGYGITIEPNFDESKALWLLHGGILAIPNIRGGGAGGSEWGMAGRRLKKQNAIDDFIAAAEYLIDEKYTNSEHLGINGGSHGGLLVGAAITQRPELFKAAIAEAGPFDMLRFGNYTIGSAGLNINEFGVPTDSIDFRNIKSYSPLHNIKKGVNYPNVLLITGDKDDRVPPFHSYKFLANLQKNGSPESLYLLYLISGAGHGGALTLDDWFDKELYKYAFLYSQLF